MHELVPCVDGLGSLFRVVGSNPTVEAFLNLLSAQARQYRIRVMNGGVISNMNNKSKGLFIHDRSNV